VSLVIAIAGILALTGLVFAWTGVRKLLRMQIAGGIRNHAFALGLLMVAALLLLVSSNLAVYHRLVFESPVASIKFSQIEPMYYRAELNEVDMLAQNFDVRGDEWQLDARILKWYGLANVFGLDTQYRLHRLAGRYTSIDQERIASRSVYAIGQQPEVDLWKLANDHDRWLDWLVDAAYGSAVYLPMTDGAEYEIKVSQSGLVARPVNDEARKAVSNWIGL